MENEKKIYHAPEIKIIPLKGDDMIATSGNDATDNWAFDVFGE